MSTVKVEAYKLPNSASDAVNGVGSRTSVCRACLAVTVCKSLLQNFDYCGETEVYLDMLDRSLGLKFSLTDEDHGKLVICDKCILKLRDCSVFKQQVINAMRMFENAIKTGRQEEIEKIVKEEVDETTDLNSGNNWSPAHSLECSDFNFDQKMTTEMRRQPKSEKKGITKEKLKSKHCLKSKLEKIDADTWTGISLIRKQIKEILQDEDGNAKIPQNRKGGSSAQRTKEILSMMDQEKLQCKICLKTFLNNRSLKVHINEHYSDFVCEVCGKGFALRAIYQNHFRRHATGEFTCRHCGETLPSKGQYDTHVAKHRAQKKYICKHCPERFTAFYAREKHMQDAHDIMKKYICQHCPESFLVKSMLDKHCRRHHSIRMRNYSCELCGKGFYEHMLLKRHMVVHTGERIYKCDVCSKSYPRIRTLRDHMKIHNNVRNHVCNLCGKAFVQACSLRSHLRTHEKEKNKLIEAVAIAKLEGFSNDSIETSCV